jgi:hypothetical protein
VIVGTLSPFIAPLTHSTFFNFENQRVVLYFLPPVRVQAGVVVGASLFIFEDKLACLPKWASDGLVLGNSDFASKILPVMCVNTICSVVVHIVEWALNSLVMKQIEILIVDKVVDQFDHDFTLVMCKRAVHS